MNETALTSLVLAMVMVATTYWMRWASAGESSEATTTEVTAEGAAQQKKHRFRSSNRCAVRGCQLIWVVIGKMKVTRRHFDEMIQAIMIHRECKSQCKICTICRF